MKYIQKTSLWILIGMFTYSCQTKEDIRVETAVSDNFNQNDDLYMMVLGEKLENPYTVENMQKAWQNVKKSKTVAKRGMVKALYWSTSAFRFSVLKSLSVSTLSLRFIFSSKKLGSSSP